MKAWKKIGYICVSLATDFFLFIFKFIKFIPLTFLSSYSVHMSTVVGMAMKQSEIVRLKVCLIIDYNPN